MEEQITLALALIALTLGMLFLKASVIGWNLWLHLARPEFTLRVYNAYVERPLKAFIIGLVNSVLGIFVILVMLQIKPLGLIAILLFAALCAAHMAGRTACYRVMAERLGAEPGAAPDTSRWIRGAIVVELAFCVPVLGQLLYLLATMRCAGAVFMAMLNRNRVASEAREP